MFRTAFQTGIAEMIRSGFDDEKQMQTLIEDGIGTLFPGLKFLNTEFRGMAGGERRPDTIAFDTDRNTFVVMEYKNKLSKEVVDQAKTYLRYMEGHNSDLVLAYREKMGSKPRDGQSFNWKDMYAVIIATEFSQYQITGASKDQDVELYEIKLYDDNVITVERVGGGHKGLVPKDTDPELPERMVQLYGTIHNRLLAEFPGTKVVRNDKNHSGFILPGSREYFCRIEMQKQKIWLEYSGGRAIRELKSSKFVNAGNWSEIKSKADVDRALAILKRLHGDSIRGGIQQKIDSMDRLYEIISPKLLRAFPNMVKEERKWYDRFIRDGRLLCTLGPQKARIWLYYSIFKNNPAPDHGGFVTFDKYPGWGLGHWRSEIKSETDFNRALDILKRLPTN